MHIDELDFELPPQLIAQKPCPQRDQSRLLVVRRGGSVLSHRVFAELPKLLEPGDLLILNDTKVLLARLLGRRARTGGKWEGLFLRERSDGAWELLCQTRGRPAPGDRILIEPTDDRCGALSLVLVERTAQGRWLVRRDTPGSTHELLSRYGHVPLPPYIHKGRAAAADRERYQTVYASRPGAVAAPTAGLHFTPDVFEVLGRRGIAHAFVTLHVGAGTFQPVQVDDVAEHRVEAEWAEMPAATADAIEACRARHGRVVAVGTTSTRVLETAGQHGTVRPFVGPTDLTICPPCTFRVVDALVTNFHLPRSSLLLLVAALTGMDSLRAAYGEAIAHGYRFYSYGDAMLILPGGRRAKREPPD